ncbi:fasciclin domain-containing protein [Siphonobacter sp. SORGH_AS_0500]|uniref:fasciclin domain-containing protein n=1 Tax=Siphonobacter sp. SORGH_AS_0500 TaxID=1864824 RepID=UPI00285DF18E|nr:fasciclin domain-containing protein [Siphonobacter sp. SORGH_AS_0500]MDR6198046.1 putative surface protein with fasciclin (FAS1) repeats [Siphonobacter sp. SORGH_AS_0500]
MKTIFLFILVTSAGLAYGQQHDQRANQMAKPGPRSMKATYDTTGQLGGRKRVPMDAKKDIVQNINNSHLFYMFMSAIRGVGLVQTLQGPGPYTVFAPSDSAFYGSTHVSKLLEENQAVDLRKVMSLHIVPGKFTTQQLRQAIAKGNGVARLKTISDEIVMVVEKNKKLIFTDKKGTQAIINLPDQMQKNGIIHVVNAVLLP